MREPCLTIAASEVKTADMPVAVETAASAPSSSRSRSSNVWTVGLLYREYRNRSTSPANAASACPAEPYT